MSAPLHRHIFRWFGATILITTVLVSVVIALLGRFFQSPWQKDMDRVRALIAHQAERTWEQPKVRAEQAKMVSDKLQIRVEFYDAKGQRHETFGDTCARHSWRMEVPVKRGERALGKVLLCGARHWNSGAKPLIGLLLLACVFWAASNVIARRITRPLTMLADVARSVGRGRLKARATAKPSAPQEVVSLADSVNEMAARIEKQLNDQRVLLATVSHELRTPLGHLRILAEIARDAEQNPTLFQKTVDDIEREVLEIDALVGQLLASSRLDFDSIASQQLDAAEQAARALERAGLDSQLLKVEGDPKVHGDPTLLARALANLLDNAERHGGGVQRLLVREEGAGVSFSVEDQGPGLPEGDEIKIFEPFYRGKKREKKERSLGLGLSLVRRIAEGHGGSILAENREEGGARFVLLL